MPFSASYLTLLVERVSAYPRHPTNTPVPTIAICERHSRANSRYRSSPLRSSPCAPHRLMDPFTERFPAQPLRHKAMYPPSFASATWDQIFPWTEGESHSLCSRGASACAPTSANIDWSSVLADTNKTIYVTEGELKAAKAWQRGLTIRTGRRQQHLLTQDRLPPYRTEPDAWTGSPRGCHLASTTTSSTKPNVISGFEDALGEVGAARGTLRREICRSAQRWKDGVGRFLSIPQRHADRGSDIQQRSRSMAEGWLANERSR